MNIPDKLEVLSHIVKVEFVSAAQHEDAGSYSPYHDMINLHPLAEGLTESSQAETFLHEMIECINTILDLKMNHTQITSVSATLFHIIRNNNIDFRKEQ